MTALTSSTGAVVERYAYTAYGEPKFLSGAGTVLTDSVKDNRYTYTGREWDKAMMLYHFRARMYDAESGRFCGRDPVGYIDGPSLYQFVSASPVQSVDPTGMATVNDAHNECLRMKRTHAVWAGLDPKCYGKLNINLECKRGATTGIKGQTESACGLFGRDSIAITLFYDRMETFTDAELMETLNHELVHAN